VVAEALLDFSLRILVPGLKARPAIILIYCLGFALVILVVDESFSTVVKLYTPTLVLAFIAAAADRRPLIASGLLLSAIAALLQQAHVALHPVYFDHNAVYHVVQAAALVILYFGFRAPRSDTTARAG
jgi:hypothetical protein